MSDKDPQNDIEHWKALPQPMRAQALIGLYMYGWNWAEFSLDSRLAEALKLDLLQRTVVGQNMDIYNKIQTLRTIIGFGGLGSDLKKNYDDALKRMLKLVEDRNKVAHWPASGDEKTGGVVFHGYKTKGKFAIADMVWSVEEVWEKYTELNELAQALDKYADQLKVQEKSISPLLDLLLKHDGE